MHAYIDKYVCNIHWMHTHFSLETQKYWTYFKFNSKQQNIYSGAGMPLKTIEEQWEIKSHRVLFSTHEQ